MTLIDEHGRLFGLINFVDALLVLVALSVVATGVTFAFASGADTTSSDTATRYATLDLGTQPAYVATLITEGDAVDSNPDDVENLTITDVYATETDDGHHLYARVRLNGTLSEDGAATYDGDPLRVGRNLDLTTPEYQTDGTITAVDATNPDLPTGNTDVLLRTTLAPDTVDAMRTGEEYRIDGRTIGTVRSIEAYRTDNPDQVMAYVGVTYRAYRASDGPRVAGMPVREGVTLPFETNAYAFEGEIVRHGATEPRGQQATRTVHLEIENADPDLADGLRSGMAEHVRGETVAELTSVDTEPATMVLTSQDGNVYRRDHPVEEDVTLIADLRVRSTNTGLRFKGGTLRQGRTVALDFGTVTVKATVVEVR
jgi:hypothetical protein